MPHLRDSLIVAKVGIAQRATALFPRPTISPNGNPIETPTFIQLFPRLYHLTFAQNLPGIREHGLRSPQSLADLHAFTPEERDATLNTRRRCIQDLHGLSIRDQHTAPEAKMKSCLVRITIPEWLTLLNSKVFFFLSREKALRLAERYADYENILLEVDTAALLATHAAATTLCKINSGAFLQNPRPRGRDSFIPIAQYAYKKSRDTPAELTIDTPIPNILQIATISHLDDRLDAKIAAKRLKNIGERTSLADLGNELGLLD